LSPSRFRPRFLQPAAQRIAGCTEAAAPQGGRNKTGSQAMTISSIRCGFLAAATALAALVSNSAAPTPLATGLEVAASDIVLVAGDRAESSRSNGRARASRTIGAAVGASSS
jgi:hypothetical protein